VGFLNGKTALVTGGTRGIGRACAEALYAEGASVVINGRSPEKGAQAAEEMGGRDRVLFLSADVTTAEACYGLVDDTIAHFGQIDILVNNAGGSVGSALLWEMEEADWHKVMNWNLNHPMWTSRRAIPNMIERGWGRIINISSIYGKMALPTVSHYVTTKHGLNGLTKALAVETGELGIRVNAICPGFVRTDIFEAEGPVTAAAMGMEFEDWVSGVTQLAATKTVNEASQVGAMCAFLCSEAGDGITGAMLNVDGGASPY
jgi:NAD(P)-dependent dehydrogenase (short-subunit alcohol dehydrogenase family)